MARETPGARIEMSDPKETSTTRSRGAATQDATHAASGDLRPTDARVATALRAIGEEELRRRRGQAAQLLREHAIAYDADESAREGREFEVTPALLEEAEWQQIERGLVQRAELLARILADLYGPRTLLLDGLIHPACVYGTRLFVRAAHELLPAGARHLWLTAFDVTRGTDGVWRVRGHSSGRARGLGRVLENRLVVARTLPDIFQASDVRRLRPFYLALHQSLVDASPRKLESPSIVTWSTAASGAEAFEDAYLAQYLGYPLVVSEDLTVRGNKVWLKTLGGLERVDVILRRVDSRRADPLSIQSPRAGGVAGLVGAARAGNVALANPIGSALTAVQALATFLPSLCRHLLGEDLVIESEPCWWCGDPSHLEEVVTRLDELELRPALEPLGGAPIVPALLSTGEREELVSRLRARPQEFIACEPTAASQLPVDGSEVSSTPSECGGLSLRCFAGASGDSFNVLPGAIASLQVGAPGQERTVCKDVWVLSDRPQPTSARGQTGSLAIEPRRSEELPSRSAEDLYWLGRYQERAEGLLRILRRILLQLTEESIDASEPEVGILLAALGRRGLFSQLSVPYARDQGLENALVEALFDAQVPASFHAQMAHIRRLSSTVRARLSQDTWRIIGRVEKELVRPAPKGRVQLSDTLDATEDSLVAITALGGLLSGGMTRSVSWQFMDLGLRIERVLGMLDLVAPLAWGIVEPDPAVLATALDVADASMTYRMRYRSSMRLSLVLDLLLRDETNPHSVLFQLDRMREHLDRLRGEQAPAGQAQEERDTIQAASRILLVDPEQLMERDAEGKFPALVSLLDATAEDVRSVSVAVSRRYLTHVATMRELDGFGGMGAP